MRHDDYYQMARGERMGELAGRTKPAIVGDVRLSQPMSAEYCETVLRLLEDFMAEHGIDKIDVGWGRRTSRQADQ